MSQIILDKVISPSTPSIGSLSIYAKPDDNLYIKNDDGTEHAIVVVSITDLSNDILFWDTATGVWKNRPNTASSSILSTTTKTANYIVTNTDYMIRVDASLNAVTITLPSAISNTGKVIVVKRVDSSNNRVITNTTDSQLIDGSLTTELTLQYESLSYQSNGTGWDII